VHLYGQDIQSILLLPWSLSVLPCTLTLKNIHICRLMCVWPRRDFKTEEEIQLFLRSFPASFPTVSANRLRQEGKNRGRFVGEWLRHVGFFFLGGQQTKRDKSRNFYISRSFFDSERMTSNSFWPVLSHLILLCRRHRFVLMHVVDVKEVISCF